METLDIRIKKFLAVSYGYGSGYGDGYGDGSGSGDGYGSGSGDGSGDGYGSGYGSGDGSGYGSGYGYGDGYGDGDGLESLNNIPIYIVDSLQTQIISIRNNVAKGFIIYSDLSRTPCFIVKKDDLFAHGSTIKDAVKSLENKLFENYTVEERIIKFKENFKDFSKKYTAIDLFDWHGRLTNSCNFGRRSFCKDKSIDIDNDSFTIFEFIELTKDSYGGDIIKQIK